MLKHWKLYAGAISIVLTIALACGVIDIETKPVETQTIAIETKLEVFEDEEADLYYDIPISYDLQDYISSLCEEYNIPKEIVYGIIETESNFNPDAISDTSDYGLMQINSINFQKIEYELGITDMMNPYNNIKAGIHLLSSCLEYADGSYIQALMIYNNGLTGAKAKWEQGIYYTHYSKKVLNNSIKYVENDNEK